MTNQPFPPVPNPNEPDPSQPAPGSSRVNFGTETNLYVVNNYFGTTQSTSSLGGAPGHLPAQPPAVTAPAELDFKGRTAEQVRRRKTWSWVGLILGGIVMFGAVTDPGGVRDFLGTLTAGAAIAIPGAWWLRCERQDRTALAEWEQRARRNAELKGMLGSEYDAVARGMGSDPRPEPVDRKWRLVIGAAIAVLFISGSLSG